MKTKLTIRQLSIIACLAPGFISEAASAPVGKQYLAQRSSAVLNVKMACSREKIGSVIRTWYCRDGYQCLAGTKRCEAGPELRRRLEDEERRQREQGDETLRTCSIKRQNFALAIVFKLVSRDWD